jgi:hypothetical protein
MKDEIKPDKTKMKMKMKIVKITNNLATCIDP